MPRQSSMLKAFGLAWVAVCVAGPVAAQTFSNSAPIIIRSSGAGGSNPSRIVVSGVGTSLTGLSVTLHAVGHTFPDDVDVALVGPTGAAVVLQSDCGGSAAIGKVTYSFSDSGPALLPNAGGIGPGTYRPTDCESSDGLAALRAVLPGLPAGGVATLGAVFGGTDPNGTWSLYVVDDSSGDSGIIQEGWSLTITSTPVELQKFTAD